MIGKHPTNYGRVIRIRRTIRIYKETANILADRDEFDSEFQKSSDKFMDHLSEFFDYLGIWLHWNSRMPEKQNWKTLDIPIIVSI